MTDEKQIAPYEPEETAVAVREAQVPQSFMNWSQGSRVFEQLSQLASKFAKSDLCPDQFKGKEGDCFIALQIAHRMDIDPFVALQNLNVVRGKPSWSAQFVIARANERGPFSDRIKFKTEGEGSTLKVTAFATLKETGEVVKATVSMQMAIDEGWVSKNTKYKTMPEQMLCYRSGVFLTRRYAPELMLGIQTAEEAEDVVVSGAREVTNEREKKSKALNEKIKEVKDAKEKQQFI